MALFLAGMGTMLLLEFCVVLLLILFGVLGFGIPWGRR